MIVIYVLIGLGRDRVERGLVSDLKRCRCFNVSGMKRYVCNAEPAGGRGGENVGPGSLMLLEKRRRGRGLRSGVGPGIPAACSGETRAGDRGCGVVGGGDGPWLAVEGSGEPRAGNWRRWAPERRRAGSPAVGSSERGAAGDPGSGASERHTKGRVTARMPSGPAPAVRKGEASNKSPRVRPGKRYGDFTPVDEAKSPRESREENP